MFCFINVLCYNGRKKKIESERGIAYLIYVLVLNVVFCKY